MVGVGVILVWLVISSVITIIFGFVVVLFGKLMWLQFRVWLLARRGFHLVEHIGTDKVRRYFYLRPRDNKFDFNKGFYLHIPETTTKAGELIKGVPKSFKISRLDKVKVSGKELSRFDELISSIESDLVDLRVGSDKYDKLKALLVKTRVGRDKLLEEVDEGEYKRLEESITKFKYSVDAVTLRWGIPVITYVGNDPNPILFSERDKVYGAPVIRDVYIRLLATQKYGEFNKWIRIGVVALFLVVVVLAVYYFLLSSSASNLTVCQVSLDAVNNDLLVCVNKTAGVLAQNRTIIV